MIAFFSLRGWGIIFLGVGKALYFYGDNRRRHGIGRYRGTFSNGKRGEHGGCALQYEGPVQAHIISCQVQRHAYEKEEAKHLRCDMGEIFQAGDLIVCDGG